LQLLLENKNALILGIANKWSIGWGIARAFDQAGAKQVFTYRRDHTRRNLERLNQQLTQPAHLLGPCDVQDDEQMEQMFSQVEQLFDGKLDILVHSVAHADRNDLQGKFVATSRSGFEMAHNVSAYSLISAARFAKPLMRAGGSIITISFGEATQVAPGYKVMGVAKAALEASVRYLADDLGPQNIRVNTISAGPLKTVAASGVPGLQQMLNQMPLIAPLRRNIDLEQVGDTAVFLASNMARGITGEIIHVDSGYHILGLTIAD
jgi:enoyl-[acyl-carrier protein] reductase I